jgi:hypothetical protein
MIGGMTTRTVTGMTNMEDNETKSQTDMEWEQRTLCIDESCIGVIGPDGRCKECGLAFEGKLPEIIREEADETNVEAPDIDEMETVSEEEVDLEWEQRTLCIDESCIGVIGSDGRCKECGKPYDNEEQEGPPNSRRVKKREEKTDDRGQKAEDR